MRDAKKDLQDADKNIEILSDILDMVQAVDTARQVARRKEMQKNNRLASRTDHQVSESTQPKKKNHNAGWGDD